MPVGITNINVFPIKKKKRRCGVWIYDTLIIWALITNDYSWHIYSGLFWISIFILYDCISRWSQKVHSVHIPSSTHHHLIKCFELSHNCLHKTTAIDTSQVYYKSLSSGDWAISWNNVCFSDLLIKKIGDASCSTVTNSSSRQRGGGWPCQVVLLPVLWLVNESRGRIWLVVRGAGVELTNSQLPVNSSGC